MVSSALLSAQKDKKLNQKQSPITATKIDTESSDKFTLVSIYLNKRPEWKSLPIEDHKSFLQITGYNPQIQFRFSVPFFGQQGKVYYLKSVYNPENFDEVINQFEDLQQNVDSLQGRDLPKK